MRTSTSFVTVLAASLPLVLLGAGSASAGKPYDREVFRDDIGPEPAEICGIPATLTARVHGVSSTRVVPGSDGQAFFAKQVIHIDETWTTAAGSITVRINSSLAETTATKVPGSVTYTANVDEDPELETVTSPHVWLFSFRDSGSFRVFDADGRLLVKATGTFRAQEQFDTLGDSQPGGRPVPGTFEVLKDQTGRTAPDDICAVAIAELT